MLPPPDAFGRGVVVTGDAAPPAPWSSAPAVVVDEATLDSPGAVVGQLHEAWARRRPVTVRLFVDPARFRVPVPVTAEPWTLTADFEPLADRLQFLVWANTYDARGVAGAGGGEPVWWWARKAGRLGALPVGAGSAGDVVLPDGRQAWIDAGPRRTWPAGSIDGAVVVHAESVERDRLTVAPSLVGPQGVAAGDLAPDQLAAVTSDAGAARVVAPAGSGKTRVLTERLRHLLVDRGWEPDCVLAVAYNKKAQEELDQRTAGTGARTRTLNSLGLAVLTRARGAAPAVLAERDVRRVVERLAPPARRRSNTDPIAPYLEGLSAVRLGLRDPGDVEASRDDVPGLAVMWPRFRAALAEAGAVDFDEQVYGAVEALLRDGSLRAEMRLGCRHLLVDEFQDLTPAHVLLLRLLAGPALDCFGVGDDDQVIYGHAGADPRFLLEYDRLFPGAADHRLEVNYRCRPAVVTAAVALLGHNRQRVDKTIRASRPPAPAGSPPALDIHLHGRGEGITSLVEVVRARLALGAAAGDIAVLARVNALLLGPVIALGEAGVAVQSAVSPDVLERTGMRAALAYLRIAVADGAISSGDLVEVLRRPSRGLPPWFTDRLRRRKAWSIPALEGIGATIPHKDSARIERFVDDIVALRAAATQLDTAGLLRFVQDDVGLGGAMNLLDASRGGEGSSHVDDLEALEAVAALHPTPDGFDAWLRTGLARPPQPCGVTVATVHRVKGMEWDHVVVAAVNAGIVPHRLAEDVEEERRVLHVALTRGRETVTLLADRSRPSPMLDELRGIVGSDPKAVPAGAAARGGGGAGPRVSSPATRVPLPVSGAGRSDPALEAALRSWRKQRASADGVPAYMVFADRTLLAIAARRPANLVALRRVDGIGPAKLERYGAEIIALVSAMGCGTGGGA